VSPGREAVCLACGGLRRAGALRPVGPAPAADLGRHPGKATGSYPGDELIPGPAHSTMATTLPAPPERVWPWLVQMGYDRAGWYRWNKVDHGGEPSADRIVPQWQNLTEGGQRLNSIGKGRNWMTVTALETNRTLVLRSIYQLHSFHTPDPRSGPLPRARVDAIWGFHLRPAPAEPAWWSVSAAGARERTRGRSTCYMTPCTSSCRPASSTTCAPGSAHKV
jgi:hypothetical protein